LAPWDELVDDDLDDLDLVFCRARRGQGVGERGRPGR
jgi:hypothetical protein